MNCAGFAAWLDDGRPASRGDAARQHARACPRCSASLDAALELEAAFGSTPAAPIGFTDRVMARVAATPQASVVSVSVTAVVLPVTAPALPWWVRAAQQPATLMAAVLVALLVGWGDAILRGAATGASWLAQAAGASASVGWLSLVEDPRVAAACVIALAPSLVWASRRAYALGRRLAG